MIWIPSKNMSWTCTDTDGLLAKISKVKNTWHWMLADTETGVIMQSGKEKHPVNAMQAVKEHIDALLDLRGAFKEMSDESVY